MPRNPANRRRIRMAWFEVKHTHFMEFAEVMEFARDLATTTRAAVTVQETRLIDKKTITLSQIVLPEPLPTPKRKS